MVVKLRGDVANLGKISPSNVREVVVLVVIPHVVRQAVQRAVIGVRLGLTFHDVVLGNEMAGCGMDRASQEAGSKEPDHHLWPEEVDHQAVERKLDNVVENHPGVPHHERWLHKSWPKRVEEDLKKHEDCLSAGSVDVARGCVGQKPPLQSGRDVRVHAVLSLVPVMLHVIRLEVNSVGDGNGKVCHQGDQLVSPDRGGTQVMSQLVDCQEK
mmetsp:Transcript_6082/g.11122  ORF Transcript_6082/g.11122 Transcript_6082/m.11122 type:complete len:212 (+) Transcript_6082:251-886(+)